MQPAATILIVKSGISNHAASGILDELCLSKFGTFHAACLRVAGHTPGTVQTWKDTELDVRRGTEEILGFCFKELPPLVAFWNFIFSNILIIKHIPF